MTKYIVNTNKKIIHSSKCYCVKLIDPNNQLHTDAYDLDKFKGFRPCSKCLEKKLDEYIARILND